MDFSVKIWAYCKQDSFGHWETHLFHTLEYIFTEEFCYLFLELAIMLNISKWMYYFLVIKTHRNIRLYEINEEIISERNGSYTTSSVDDSTEITTNVD